MELKGTKTEENLMKAFAGETEARTKYDYYASQAIKDGYEQIAGFFLETSMNEREHAKLWFKLLKGGKIPNTIENLKDAAKGEHYEYSEMYKEFAEVAKAEGFNDIAGLFEGVAKIENHHEERYLKLLKNIEEGIVFKRGEETMWICRNCGNIVLGESSPEICPVCSHPQAFYQINKENY